MSGLLESSLIASLCNLAEISASSPGNPADHEGEASAATTSAAPAATALLSVLSAASTAVLQTANTSKNDSFCIPTELCARFQLQDWDTDTDQTLQCVDRCGTVISELRLLVIA